MRVQFTLVGALFVSATLLGCSNVDRRNGQSHAPARTSSDIPAWKGAADAIQTIRLDDLYLLNVRRNSHKQSIVVELMFGKAVVKSYEVGNAFAAKVSIESVNLDPANGETEYLICIPDRTSTYGAQTGIIVYRLQGWEFLLVPDDWFTVMHANGSDSDQLHCGRIQKKSYGLFHGILRETTAGISTP